MRNLRRGAPGGTARSAAVTFATAPAPLVAAALVTAAIITAAVFLALTAGPAFGAQDSATQDTATQDTAVPLAVTPSPDPTATPTPTPSPTATLAPSPSPTASPTPSASPTAAPSPTASPSPSVAPTATPSPSTTHVIPPRVTQSTVSSGSLVAAIAVLGASVALLFVLVRRGRNAPPPAVFVHPAAATLTLEEGFATLEVVGEAMIDAGYSVNTVQESLEHIARVNGQPRTEVVVMPTALFVSSRDHVDVRTGVVSSGRSPLLLHQVDALDRTVVRARTGQLSAVEARDRVLAMREATPPFGTAARVLAAAVVSAALAVILGGSWASMVLAAVLGAGIGLAVIASAAMRVTLQPLVTVGAAFVCAVVVFLVARSGLDLVALPTVIAPLVVLLPGALLTTGVVELATGQMMSGAGRLAAGFMRLVLLAGGIVAGATLVGVPHIPVAEHRYPMGLLAPWIAVAFFGIAVVINRGGLPKFIPWIVLVLYVAYSAQVIGSLFFSGAVAAFVGACTMTPVAILVSRFARAPAPSVSFLPAFWLLVPGGLGLVGVTAVLDGGGTGLATLALTVTTMVAIALGILTGSALKIGPRSDPTVLI